MKQPLDLNTNLSAYRIFIGVVCAVIVNMIAECTLSVPPSGDSYSKDLRTRKICLPWVLVLETNDHASDSHHCGNCRCGH